MSTNGTQISPLSHGPDGLDVAAAILSRKSIRAFIDRPVERALLEKLLETAARAPSGTNMQPWRIHALTGAPLKALSQALLAAFEEPPGTYTAEYKYYPDVFFEPYLSRRRKVGLDLYSLVGIAKGDTARMRQQTARNYLFFDAPVGLISTIDRRLEIGSWLDHGMFLQNVMIAARGLGLDTCPQAAFAHYHKVIREHVPIGEDDVVVCGMALGYAAHDRIENTLVTERAPLSEFATFSGF